MRDHVLFIELPVRVEVIFNFVATPNGDTTRSWSTRAFLKLDATHSISQSPNEAPLVKV